MARGGRPMPPTGDSARCGVVAPRGFRPSRTPELPGTPQSGSSDNNPSSLSGIHRRATGPLGEAETQREEARQEPHKRHQHGQHNEHPLGEGPSRHHQRREAYRRQRGEQDPRPQGAEPGRREGLHDRRGVEHGVAEEVGYGRPRGDPCTSSSRRPPGWRSRYTSSRAPPGPRPPSSSRGPPCPGPSRATRGAGAPGPRIPRAGPTPWPSTRQKSRPWRSRERHRATGPGRPCRLWDLLWSGKRRHRGP
jgi:hypothetical protein